MFRTKKRFGQHFLKDKGILLAIADYCNLQKGDFCLEIGPGQGALTRYLLETGANVHAVEIDKTLVPYLEKMQAKYAQFSFTLSDVLEVPLDTVIPTKQAVKVVGNLPYEISTPLLFKLIQDREKIQEMVFLLQKEVVDRIVATPNTKAYGRLAVMLQYYFETSALKTVPKEAFSPPPKVLSQVVRLKPLQRDWVDHERFEAFVKHLFLHQRKMLRQRFKAYLEEGDWENLGIDPTERPQNLELDRVLQLFNHLEKKEISF